LRVPVPTGRSNLLTQEEQWQVHFWQGFSCADRLLRPDEKSGLAMTAWLIVHHP